MKISIKRLPGTGHEVFEGDRKLGTITMPEAYLYRFDPVKDADAPFDEAVVAPRFRDINAALRLAAGEEDVVVPGIPEVARKMHERSLKKVAA